MEASIPVIAANLIVNELLPRLNRRGIAISESPVAPEDIRVLAMAKAANVFTTRDIRKLLDARFDSVSQA